MGEAVIVSTARTPVGKAFRGAFNKTHGAVLAGHAIRHAVERGDGPSVEALRDEAMTAYPQGQFIEPENIASLATYLCRDDAGRITMENLMAAESNIRDADFAFETSKLARDQILIQAGTSVLAIANQTPQTVLRLLG